MRRGRKSAGFSGGSGGRHRSRARRPHNSDRALPGRAGRLARVRADTLRQPHPHPLGNGCERADSRGGRAWTWKRSGVTTALSSFSGHRGAARQRTGFWWSRPRSCRWCCGSSVPRRCLREVSRSRGPGTAAAAAPGRRALAALAVAQALLRPAQRGLEVPASPCCLRLIASVCAMSSTCPRFMETLRSIEQRHCACM